MPVVQAQFDGQVFVPCETVQLPAGTRVEVVIPGPPPPLSAEEQKEWEEYLRELRAEPPYFPTADEAIRYSRKRP